MEPQVNASLQDKNLTLSSDALKLPQLTVTILRDLPNIMLVIVAFAFACSSLMLNYCVLRVLVKVKRSDLKSKVFLFNSLVCGVVFPISYCLSAVTYIAVALGLREDQGLLCLDGMKAIFEPMTQYAQALSALLMAIDRLYAILAPFTYYSLAYPTIVSVTSLFILWVLSFFLTLPVFLNFWNQDTGEEFCKRFAYGHLNWNNVVRFPIVIGVYLLVFVFYMVLLILVKFRRIEGRSTNSDLYRNKKRESLSLVITFFGIHLSALCLFVPGPLFAILMRSGLIRMDFTSMWRIRRALILVYMTNSMIDPCIVIARIPSVKHQMKLTWKLTQ